MVEEKSPGCVRLKVGKKKNKNVMFTFGLLSVSSGPNFTYDQNCMLTVEDMIALRDALTQRLDHCLKQCQ